MNPIDILFSLPKSLYVNFRLLPFKRAIRLPILVKYNTVVKGFRGGEIVFTGNLRFGMFSMGFGEISEFDNLRSRAVLKVHGTIFVGSRTRFGPGSSIVLEPKSQLYIGNNFVNTAKTIISCWNYVSIGKNCLLSWNTFITDTDFHPTYNPVTKEVHTPLGRTEIGDNVWIGQNSVILKNSSIPNGCIIGANTLVNKSFTTENCLIAGSPAQIKRESISIYRNI